jgi:prolyl-tRNA synthetase
MSDILFSLQGHGGSKMFLNPTHEEIITPLAQKYVFSYKDLPLAVYQIQNKFRNEPRAKSGLLRGREFNMKDLYSFHQSKESLDEYYEIVKNAYYKIYNRLGIGEITYLTFASGGTFSKYSHEFQTVCDAGEDTIYICKKCNVAVNKEIFEEQNTCPDCGNKKLTEEKAIEVGNIFKQSTKFTSAFGFSCTDENGDVKPVEMAAYGIGPSRIMGALVEIFHDENGIMWPESVSPFHSHLLTIGKENETHKAAEEIYKKLSQKYDILFDDRDCVSTGEKFADADMIGITNRIVVSKKTLATDSVEIKRRGENKVEIVPISKL